MSLIHEALKRAEREHPSRDGDSSAERIALLTTSSPGQPAEYRPNTRAFRAALFVVVVIAAVGLVTYLSLPLQDKPVPAKTAGHEPPATPPAQAANVSAETAWPPALPIAPPQSPEPQPAQAPVPEASAVAAMKFKPVSPLVVPPVAPPAPAMPSASQPATVEPEKPKPPALKLGGIMRSGGVARAIINNHLVAAGDEIDGARVVKIGKYTVEVEWDGQTFLLRM